MRHQISWADLRGRRVAVWGLGVEGRTNLRKLRSLGVEPVVVDDAAGDAGALGAEVLPTHPNGMAEMRRCDVVVKTPGLSRYRPEVAELESAGVAVVGGLGLWVEEAPLDRVVLITGTKGKSTTTAVAAHLARRLGIDAFAGGNLGSPPYDPDLPAERDLWFVETSSYQATDVASSPPLVAVTSLAPDHIPWHGDEATYYRDKLSLCVQRGAALTVASSVSPILVEHADLLGPRVRWVSERTWAAGWSNGLGLVGEHNVVNAGIARACLQELGIDAAFDDEQMRDAAAGFGGLESRLQLVATVDQVDYYDDGLSTNVLPTLAAVGAFSGRRVALIAGGLDRRIDYAPLADGLALRTEPTLVLACYQTGPQIKHAVDALASPQVEAVSCSGLDEAVRLGTQWARPDGVVLLSPAAASFDAFKDYRARSHAFRTAIETVGGACS